MAKPPTTEQLAEKPAKRKRITLRSGEVFEIPVSDGRLGYGVIIVGGKVPYVIILKSLHSVCPPLSELAKEQIGLVGWTMDALIYHGRWKVLLRDYPPRSDIPYPNWKLGFRTDDLRTTNFEGNVVLGPCRPDERELLDHKFSRAPIAYQDALEALHGLQPWNESYDKLTPAYAFKRVTRAL